MKQLARIGGPSAINRWSFVGTAVLVLGAALLSPAVYAGGVNERLLVATGGLAGALPVLVLARATVLHPGVRPFRPWIAIATFALAGAVQGLVVLIFRERLGLVTDDAIVLVIARTLAAGVWLATVALLVDDVRAHGARMAELRVRVNDYEQALDDEQSAEDDGQAVVYEVLEPLLRGLDELGEQLGRHASSTRGVEQVDALRLLIGSDVRQLSHELLAWIVPAEEPFVSPSPVRMRVGDVARLATSMVAGPIWLAVLMPTALALLFAVQRVGLVYLAFAMPCSTLLLACGFWAARRWLDPLRARVSRIIAGVALCLFYEALAVIAVVNAYLWGTFSLQGRVIEWSLLFTLPLIWFAIALRAGVERTRQFEVDQLGEVIHQQALELARRRQRQQYVRQSLARVLHGTVQASLLAITARVEQADQMSEDRRAIELGDAAVELRELRDRIVAPAPEAWETKDALATVIALWTDILDVQLDCSSEVFDRVDRSPSTRSALVDVVAEALTNALRHGKARGVRVTVTIEDADRLVVAVYDDGFSDVSGEPGLGSHLYDVLTLEWAGVYGVDGGRFGAVIPLVGGSEAGRSQPPITFG